MGETQQHNFHAMTDEDWVMFYAPRDMAFEIRARQVGTNSDVRLELYSEQPDSSLILVDWVDDYGAGTNVAESLTVDLKTGNSGLEPRIYYLRVSSADTNLFGPGSEYELQIYAPIAGAGGVPFPGIANPGGLLPIGSFYVFLGSPQALAAGVGWRITQVTNQNYFSNNAVIYSLPASSNYTLAFRDVPGFQAPTNRTLAITAEQTRSVMAYYLYTNLSPRAESPRLSTNGVFPLTFLACAGKRYALEEGTNLHNWIPLVTNLVPQDGALHFTRTNGAAQAGAFYRARFVP